MTSPINGTTTTQSSCHGVGHEEEVSGPTAPMSDAVKQKMLGKPVDLMARLHLHHCCVDHHPEPKPPPPPANPPAQDAHDCCCHGSDGYSTADLQAAIDQALAQLKNDPVYQEQNKRLDDLQNLLANFDKLDSRSGFLYLTPKDGELSIDELTPSAVAKFFGISEKEAGQFLANNKDLFRQIDTSGNGKIGKDEILAFMAQTKNSIANMEKGARDSAILNLEKQHPPHTHNPPSGGSTNPPATGANPPSGGSVGVVGDAPAPAEVKGPETGGNDVKPGTGEPRVGSTSPTGGPTLAGNVGAFGDAISTVQNNLAQKNAEKAEALKNGDTAKAAQLEQEISNLNMALQMLMSSMQQLQQLLSNLAKMWSDIAMASIRNTHS